MDTYISTNTSNGRFYIGSTTNFEWRKYCHLNNKRNYPFQNALRKTPEAFIWEVFSDESDEPVLEQALLDMFYGTEQCYNLSPRANRPPSRAGVPVSEETRRKIRENNKGRKKSKETKQKISEAMRGQNNPMFGKTGSANPSFNVRGGKHPFSKKVEVTYPDGAVKVFPSASDASGELGVHPVSVADAARKNRTKTKGKLTGYSFRYLPS